MPGPFNRSYQSLYFPRYGSPIIGEDFSTGWYTSGKNVDGSLNKLPQPYSRALDKLTAFHQTPSGGLWVTPVWSNAVNQISSGTVNQVQQEAYNKAYFRFWNMLRGNDTAGLGVNLTQWRQTWSMISRSQDRIYSMMKDAAVESRRRGRNGSLLQKERFADLFLEKQFGWAPLFSDIWASAKLLAGWSDTPLDSTLRWFSQKATAFTLVADYAPDAYSKYLDRSVQVRATVSAMAVVSNPNLWIANRMGLVNPAAIAWDRVPWSFLVGMFSNISGYLNSFTNELGVSLSHGNITYSTRQQGGTWMKNTYPPSHPFYAEGTAFGVRVRKQRVLTDGVLPRPTLQVFLPKLEWTNALIGSSLLYQQVSNRGTKILQNHKGK